MTILPGTGLERSARLEDALGSGFVAPLLQQDVEFDGMLVDRTPQRIPFATKRDEHLVEVLRATRLASHRFHPMSKALIKLVTQHRIVSYVTTTQRSKSSCPISYSPNRKRKYHRTAQLMTPSGKRWL